MGKNISLVLSSGGARGIAQIGAIEELNNQGYNIQSVSGCSIGSIIGGMYAKGELNAFKNWICKLSKKDVFRLMEFTFNNSGFLKSDRAVKKLEELFPDVLIENMDIPFTAVSTDIIKGVERVYSSGSYYEAVRASIAIPGIINSVKNSESTFVDGGVLNPLPIKQVRRNNDDLLVVINLYGENEEKAPSQNSFLYYDKLTYLLPSLKNNNGHNIGYFQLLSSASSAMVQKIAQQSIELGNPDIVIDIPRNLCGTFDFHRSTFLIERGRIATRRAIEAYKQKKEVLKYQ